MIIQGHDLENRKVWNGVHGVAFSFKHLGGCISTAYKTSIVMLAP